MQILIQSVNFPTSEVLNEKIEKKMKKAFEKYPYILKGKVFLKVNLSNEEIISWTFGRGYFDFSFLKKIIA